MIDLTKVEERLAILEEALKKSEEHNEKLKEILLEMLTGLERSAAIGAALMAFVGCNSAETEKALKIGLGYAMERSKHMTKERQEKIKSL